tara:strand:- start:151 stop:540 length:390 start_codon:yes stop_codon:yes gene_type:complete
MTVKTFNEQIAEGEEEEEEEEEEKEEQEEKKEEEDDEEEEEEEDVVPFLIDCPNPACGQVLQLHWNVCPSCCTGISFLDVVYRILWSSAFPALASLFSVLFSIIFSSNLFSEYQLLFPLKISGTVLSMS